MDDELNFCEKPQDRNSDNDSFGEPNKLQKEEIGPAEVPNRILSLQTSFSDHESETPLTKHIYTLIEA